jgi:hypothetical protein
MSYVRRCQAHRFECLKNCNAAGFFTLKRVPCVSRMVHHRKDIKSTCHNVWKHWSQQGSASLWNASTPCVVVHAPNDYLRLFWGKRGVQLNIRKLFLMVSTFSVTQAVNNIFGRKENCVPCPLIAWQGTHTYRPSLLYRPSLVGHSKQKYLSSGWCQTTYVPVLSDYEHG